MKARSAFPAVFLCAPVSASLLRSLRRQYLKTYLEPDASSPKNPSVQLLLRRSALRRRGVDLRVGYLPPLGAVAPEGHVHVRPDVFEAGLVVLGLHGPHVSVVVRVVQEVPPRLREGGTLTSRWECPFCCLRVGSFFSTIAVTH